MCRGTVSLPLLPESPTMQKERGQHSASGSDDGLSHSAHSDHEPAQAETPCDTSCCGSIRRREMREWAHIPVEDINTDVEMFPAGWKFCVYDGKQSSHYYEIPSEWVAITHGGVRYAEHFNECGPYSRFRFQLCNNFILGRCHKGRACTYVHALQIPECNTVHMFGHSFPTLPPGAMLTVFSPNPNSPAQYIPTECIIRTAGAEAALQGTRRPQHCAHYQFKRVCNRGPTCNFIHSHVPAPRQ